MSDRRARLRGRRRAPWSCPGWVQIRERVARVSLARARRPLRARVQARAARRTCVRRRTHHRTACDMTSKKERRKERKNTYKLIDDAWEALESGHEALADRLARRAVEKGAMNPRIW